MIRRLAPAIVALSLIAPAAASLIVLAAAAAAASPTPKASLTDIEQDVMCPSCREPLALAQSPQAVSERAFIAGLINQGLTKAQIEQQLVAQYGTDVLGRPPAHGFNLLVYILPPALVVAGVALLAVTLPKWRRRAKQAAATQLQAGSGMTAADARRLDEDLARYT